VLRTCADEAAVHGSRTRIRVQAPKARWRVLDAEPGHASGAPNLLSNAIKYSPDGGKCSSGSTRANTQQTFPSPITASASLRGRAQAVRRFYRAPSTAKACEEWIGL